MITSHTYIAIPPGATIKEQLTDRELKQKEFAARMDMTEKHISKLINGDVQLTPDVAYRLEMVLGIPASFWNNLESIYREKIIKANQENRMDKDIELSKEIPYSEMVKHRWVPPAENKSERVINIRKYFEVVDLEILNNPQIMRIACRRLSLNEKGDLSLLAWAQRAKLEARNIEVEPVNIKKLEKIIPKIRRMTKCAPCNFCPKLKTELASCGIALVILPHINGSFLHGASFYDGSKIVIGLTIRGKDADKFWFSLFHELAHVIKGHIGRQNGTTKEDEEEADKFAQNTLIPEDKFNNFIKDGVFTNISIINFSESLEIDRGIVVGRLQKKGIIPFSRHNELKTKYALSPSI